MTKIISRSEHQHRRLFTFACGAVVSSETLYTAAAWGASRNAIQAFYSLAVRDALSLRSLRSLRIVYNATNTHTSYSHTQYAMCTLEFRGDPIQVMGCKNPRTRVRINMCRHTHTFVCTHNTPHFHFSEQTSDRLFHVPCTENEKSTNLKETE